MPVLACGQLDVIAARGRQGRELVRGRQGQEWFTIARGRHPRGTAWGRVGAVFRNLHDSPR